ncbi:beta-lactamase hydrolase domain-containing protein [Lyngbya confervoides]|uniref:Sulfur transferase domain-containing protein n=1 Tax=Lyngbya confervoides BDU141951 TaxID=1574623 RepID=A0ABD4T4X1_9CYAN|nr:sulfur transferase domain-containing protein [Lyngbya confervoides]MCM1983762.1 sulfur transferase domain-containing protein [Lyngbya confervoides BDU141951]
MNHIKQITADIAVADGQLSPAQIQQAAQTGFQSILNLRSPQAAGTLPHEQVQVEQAGLTYAHIPVTLSDLSDRLTDLVLNKLDELPKPVLTHCKKRKPMARSEHPF